MWWTFFRRVKPILVGGVVSSSIPLQSLSEDTDCNVVEEKRRPDRRFRDAIKHADELVRRFKEQRGVPGISVGVAVHGRIVWITGYGYADVENLIPCSGDSVMRIASISKSMTMTLVAKLVQENQLDLDAPVQKYVPTFPEKEVDGEKVTVTTRHLVSHRGGIRHYEKPKPTTDITAATEPGQKTVDLNSNSKSGKTGQSNKGKSVCEKCGDPTAGQKAITSEFQYVEYYSQKQYNSVTDALSMFKDDPLLHKPGAKFMYTTHGWTLVSAVIEGASGKKFTDLFKELFSMFGMRQTFLDENYPLIPNRTSYYRRRSAHRFHLENVPPVDNSYKWAGGGVVSTVGDLLLFANTLLYFYHHCQEHKKSDQCYLSRKTLTDIWTPVENAPVQWAKGRYAMGWAVAPNPTLIKHHQFYVSHTGGAIGASSVLLLKPAHNQMDNGSTGIAVAILTNIQECGGLHELAVSLAELFDTDEFDMVNDG